MIIIISCSVLSVVVHFTMIIIGLHATWKHLSENDYVKI